MLRTPMSVVLAGLFFLAGCHAQAQVGEKKPAASGAAAGPKHDLGFTAAFLDEIKKVGQISPEQFAQRFPGKAEYLAKITWDPTTAKYWDRFTLDPNDPRAMTP